MTTRPWRQVLELEGTITEEMVKKAYRKKGRHIHPDRSTEANANALFQELQAAYEEGLKHTTGAAPPPPSTPSWYTPPSSSASSPPSISRFLFPTQSFKPTVTISIDMADVYTGKMVMLEYFYARLCRTCFVDGPFARTCSQCKGAGVTSNKSLLSFAKKCVNCNGTGLEGNCDACHGERGCLKKTNLKYTFPPHYDFKRFDTIAGKGHEWYADGKIHRADVDLKVNITATKGFAMEEKSGDLLTIVKIDLRQSLMLSSLAFSLPDKTTAEVAVTEIIKDGTIFQIPMLALYPTSYLYVYVQVLFPTRSEVASGFSIEAASDTMRRGMLTHGVDSRIARSKWPRWIEELIAQKFKTDSA